MAKRKITKVSPFAVWGDPPEALSKGMSARQMKALERYTESLVERCYRLAYDNGVNAGVTQIASTANKILRKQRDAILRS